MEAQKANGGFRMKKTAIVILNWNGLNYLKEFLPSVITNSVHDDVDIVVADNASTDQSVDFLEKQFPEVTIIQLDKNYGYAGGYAKALQQVKAAYFVLLNSDVETPPGWLNPLIRFMDKHPHVGACMPKIKAYHDKQMFEYAGASGGYIDKYGYPFCRGRILNTIEKDTGQYDDTKYIFWASGACLFIRSEAYFKAGELDSDFFVHMEEIDLCWRLQNVGYKVAILPETEIYHVGGGTLPNNNPRKLYYNYRNSLYMLYKNLPQKKMYILFIRLLLDWFSAFVYLLKLDIPFFRAVFRAHDHFIKKLGQLKHKRNPILQKSNNYPLTVYQNSILKNFFVFGKRKFSDLPLLPLDNPENR